MLYREAGQFKTNYASDQALFPIAQDRWFVIGVLVVAVAAAPFIDDYWANAIMLPFLIYALAAIGLNLLTGYCGQVSLGTGGFMAVGAFATFKLVTGFPELNFLVVVLLSAKAVGSCPTPPRCKATATFWSARHTPQCWVLNLVLSSISNWARRQFASSLWVVLKKSLRSEVLVTD